MFRQVPAVSPRFLALGLSVSFLLSGCAGFGRKKPPQHPKRTAPPAVQHDDPRLQQKYYDTVLKYYTEENYAEAKKAWQQAIQAGPGTSLAAKARENLNKTERILKTLKSLEKP